MVQRVGWDVVGDPSSAPNTASHRVTGLEEGASYCFQVAARTSADETVASSVASGSTLRFGMDGIPQIPQSAVVEGGHTYRFGQWVFDVPVGMLVMSACCAINTPATGRHFQTAVLYDVASWSYFFIDVDTGEWLGRRIIPETELRPDGSIVETRDVNALFDQIEASTRRVPY